MFGFSRRQSAPSSSTSIDNGLLRVSDDDLGLIIAVGRCESISLPAGTALRFTGTSPQGGVVMFMPDDDIALWKDLRSFMSYEALRKRVGAEELGKIVTSGPVLTVRSVISQRDFEPTFGLLNIEPYEKDEKAFRLRARQSTTLQYVMDCAGSLTGGFSRAVLEQPDADPIQFCQEIFDFIFDVTSRKIGYLTYPENTNSTVLDVLSKLNGMNHDA